MSYLSRNKQINQRNITENPKTDALIFMDFWYVTGFGIADRWEKETYSQMNMEKLPAHEWKKWILVSTSTINKNQLQMN